MRSRIMLLTLAIALGTFPTHLLSQTNGSAASQDKMSNDDHMAGHDKMTQDKMKDDKSGDHMSGSDNMSKHKKHKKSKTSDSMSNGSH